MLFSLDLLSFSTRENRKLPSAASPSFSPATGVCRTRKSQKSRFLSASTAKLQRTELMPLVPPSVHNGLSVFGREAAAQEGRRPKEEEEVKRRTGTENCCSFHCQRGEESDGQQCHFS